MQRYEKDAWTSSPSVLHIVIVGRAHSQMQGTKVMLRPDPVSLPEACTPCTRASEPGVPTTLRGSERCQYRAPSPVLQLSQKRTKRLRE